MDTDILSIDAKIQEQLKKQEAKIEEYLLTLKDIGSLLELTTLDEDVKKKICFTQDELRKKIQLAQNNEAYNFYLSESLPLLQKYKSFLRKPIKICFVSNGNKNVNNDEKEQIVKEYLAIAKKYLFIESEASNEKDERKEVCQICKSNHIIISDNVAICVSCGGETDMSISTPSYKDISRTNILQKYSYERRSHFRDCINQFQGKQHCKIPAEVYEDLKAQMLKHNLLIGDENTCKEERYSRVKKEHIMLFLRELKYDKQYENLNYIYSQITGAKCYDISHLEDQLMSDFDTLVNLYIKKFKYEKKISRKSFMNIHYVFFQLLNKNKYICKKEEFNILKTADRKTFHDDIFKELFEELGWNHVPFF